MSETLQRTLATYGAQRHHLHVVRPAPAPASSVRPIPSNPAWVLRLSAREIEVLHCIAVGMSTAEIAQALFISVATVKSHVARLICKVEVRDRLQLVIAAYRSGFITVE